MSSSSFLARSWRGWVVLLLVLVQVAGQPVQAAGAAPLPSRATQPVAQPNFAPPQANTSLSVPSSPLLGQDVSFTVTFNNTGDTGYGPVIDLIIPASAGLGTSTIQISYAGSAFTLNQDYFVTTFAGNSATEALIRDHTGALVTVSTGALAGGVVHNGDKLVSIKLPFGSYSPGQPPIAIDVTVNMASPPAAVGTTMNIWARGGFQYGANPLDDWCCGDVPANTLSAWGSQPVTPVLWTISKTYSGPENETATGPNFRSFYPLQYSIAVDIAPFQTITNLAISDVLPQEIQPVNWVDQDGATTCTPDPFNIPLDQGNTIQCQFNSVTGPASGHAIVIKFDFYIPLTEPGGSSNILNPQTGAPINSCNNASVGGDWNGVTQPTLATGTAPGSCGHTLADKSLALQKTAAVVSNGTLKPGAIIQNTLTFQVSDYFAFDNLTLLDIVSDGQHFINDPGHEPSLVINGNGYTLGVPTPHIFDVTAPKNYSVDCYYTGAVLGAPCDSVNAPNSGNPDQYGTTQLTFQITNEIKKATVQDGKFFGGCVNPASGTVDCSAHNAGATIGTIVFYTQALKDFTDAYKLSPNSGDSSLDQGDKLTNVGKYIQGDVLNWNPTSSSWVPTGSQVRDDSGATLTVPLGSLDKSVYAVNSIPVSGPVTVNPGDTITYRIKYDLPVSNEENLRFTDYLPLPILDVTNPAADGSITSWTFSTTPGVMTPGTVSLGPLDTFYQYMVSGGTPPSGTGNPTPTTNPSNPADPLYHDGSILPKIVEDTTNNSLTITYPDYDDTRLLGRTVDLLITATVTNEPFADLLYLTNEAYSFEGSTNNGISQATKIIQVKVGEPVIVTKKSAIWAGNYIGSSWAAKAGVAFSPALPGSPSIVDPSNPIRWSGGNITDANYTQFNANVSHVDANDVVSYMIVLVDTGHSDKGAYDLAIKDALPFPNVFEVPTAPTGLNLQIWHGDGSGADYGKGPEEIKYTGLGGAPSGFTSPGGDLFGNGIELVDPADNPYSLTPGPGDVAVCQAHTVGPGKNVIIITYDLQIISGVTPGSYTNTATNTSYASRNNGPNFVPSGGSSDTAKTVIDSVPTKYLITTSEPSTSESGTGTPANPRDVTIGEIVRFRITQTIPEGSSPGYQVHDPLPAGLTYLNDGTTTFAFYSNNNPGVSISTDNTAILASSCPYNLTVASPVVVNGTTPPSANLCPLPASDITNNSGGTTFPSGEEVHFLFGNLINNHDDPDPEAVVIEFNALVDNTVSGSSQVNYDGRILDNMSHAFINGVQAGSNSTAISLRVIESKLTVLKQAAALRTQIDQNDVVTYTVTISNLDTNGSHTDAFNVEYVDTLPSTLNLQLPLVSITGGVGMTNSSAGNTVDISFTEIAWGQTVTPGDTVTIVYKATANGTVTPAEAIQNTGTVTWTSLPHTPGPNNTILIGTQPNGTGSTVPGPSGSDNSERNGSGGTANSYHASATATINVLAAVISKLAPNPTSYPIGTTVDYFIQVSLPEGTTPALQIVDHFPDGLGYVSSQVITTVADPANPPSPDPRRLTADFNGAYTGSAACLNAASAPCSTGDTNQDLSFAFGDATVTGGGTEGTSQNVFLLLVQAQVLNVIGNQAGTPLQNTASLTYTGLATPLTSSQTITVIGPLLSLNKSASTISAHPQANDIVTYTVTISALSGPNRSNAYNIHYTDTLPTVMQLLPATVSVSANGATVVDTSSAGSPPGTPSTIDLKISEIDISQTVTITYQAKLLVSITPSDNVTNSGEVTWTSTQVVNSQTRTGASYPNSGGLNNYFQTASVSLTSQNITAEKSIVGSSASFTPNSGGGSSSSPYPLAIGETLAYRLKMVIPQGTASAVTFQDTLPLGFSYVGSPVFSFISLNNTIASSHNTAPTDLNANNHDIPPTAAFPTGLVTVTTTVGQDTVKFDLGDLVNTDTDSTTEESVIIDFTVLVNNDLNNNAFSGNVNDYLKNNNFTVQISGSTAGTSNTVYSEIVESRLSINKTVSDDHPGPGETVTYTLAIDNNTANSTTDSFDVALTDVIDSNLTLDLNSITYNFTPPASQPSWTPSPNNTSTAGQLNIGFATIPLGASVTVQYKATVNAGVTQATTILNTGNVTWTSLPGPDTHERTGTIGSTTAPNNYFASSSVSLFVLRAVSKTVAAGSIQLDTDPADITASRPLVSPPALPTVYIGETLVYTIVLTVPPGDTDTMTLTDTLDRGLAFVKCESLTPQSTDLTTDVSGTFSTDFSSICSHPTVSTEPSGSTNLADAGRKILFTFGNVHNANAASQTLTLVYDVIVLDNQENVNGLNGLANNAVWTWASGTLSAGAQGVNVQEAQLSILKTVTPQVAPIGANVSFNIHVEHTSQSAADAYDVLVTDAIPTGLAINPASVVVTAPGLPPAVVKVNLNVLTVYWSHFPLGSQADVNFTAQFIGPSPVTNTSTVEWSSIQIDPRPTFVAQSTFNTLSTERRYVPSSATNNYFGSSSAEIQTPRLPNTGFAPDVQTILPVQPLDQAYDSNGGMWLEIPALNLKMPIVGVPESGGTWDVSWLGDQAGYLEGTAYPTWAGNSVITGHVYGADGLPGPFVNIKALSWGDRVIIHYAGQQYLYEVRLNEVISPTSTSIFSHKDYPWLTLLTCKDYNAQTNSYAHRVAVGAVLVQIEAEPPPGMSSTASPRSTR